MNRDIFWDNKKLCSAHASHVGWHTSSWKYAKYLKLYSHDNYHIHLDQNSTMKSAFYAPTSNLKGYILLHRIIKMCYVQLLQAHCYCHFEHSLKYNLETQTFHFQLLHPFTFCNNRRIANTFFSPSLHSDSKHIV